MAKKKTKMVRVLFSVEIKVPLDNPNTMEEGPGPYLFGWLQDAVESSLSEIPGNAQKDIPWKNDVGSFKLEAVEEHIGKAWRRGCETCDGTGCPTCDPCRPDMERCKGTKLHHHRPSKDD